MRILAWVYAIERLHLGLPGAVLFATLGTAAINVGLDVVLFRPLGKRKAPEFAAMVGCIGGALIL